ncbi:MAG TPA: transcriptional repressor [Streptosporangiaceae bacterium]|nr:transcriptional repressor [Streptosporangiaceae bacterium]
MTGDTQARAQWAEDGEVVNNALAQLRQHGGRATSARRLLLRALLASPGHRSAEQLAADVQASAPGVNLSTIYRNLDELERLKIVDRTHLGHGPATYHLAENAHGHLVCEQCGSMTEVPSQIFTGLAWTIRDQYGFTVMPHRFAVLGTCAACQ